MRSVSDRPVQERSHITNPLTVSADVVQAGLPDEMRGHTLGLSRGTAGFHDRADGVYILRLVLAIQFIPKALSTAATKPRFAFHINVLTYLRCSALVKV